MRAKAAFFRVSFFLQSPGRWLSLNEAGLYRIVAPAVCCAKIPGQGNEWAWGPELKGLVSSNSTGAQCEMMEPCPRRGAGGSARGSASPSEAFLSRAQLHGGSVQWTCLMDKDEAEELWGPSSSGVFATELSARKSLLSHAVCSIHKYCGNGGGWRADWEPQRQTALSSWPQASGTDFVSFVFPFS